MSHNQQENIKWNSTVLLFNQHTHRLHLMLMMAGGSPRIEVPVDQIDLEFKAAPTGIEIKPGNADVHDLPVMFYRFNNVHLVLTGRNHVIRAKAEGQTTVKGKLLSSMSLKKSRVVDTTPATVPVVETNVVSRFSAQRPQSRSAMQEAFEKTTPTTQGFHEGRAPYTERGPSKVKSTHPYLGRKRA